MSGLRCRVEQVCSGDETGNINSSLNSKKKGKKKEMIILLRDTDILHL